MKKTVTLLLTIIVIFSCVYFNSSALAEEKSTSTIEYLNDGSYIITTIIQNNTSLFATNTKTSSKKTSYYNSNNDILWDATVTGTFTYTGTSSACTESSISYNIYNSNWKITSAIATKSGNEAIGTITAKRYLLGVPIQTVDRTITLTCSANGTLS